MSDQYIGEIRMFGGNFAPVGWALCNGQLLAISSNTALFSLLGTTYGGDGRTTFGLPDLRDRSPMHFGAGPGISPRDLGEVGGEPTVSLAVAQMPAHNHTLVASADDDNSASPANAAAGLSSTPLYRNDTDTTMSQAALPPAGGSGPHNNRQPYLGITFIIALQGVFPPRG
jgi:microcystin-dependent protein